MLTKGDDSDDKNGSTVVPSECLGVDVDATVMRLPAQVGALFLTAGEQRVRELDRAMTDGDAAAVMNAAHSLASLVGVLPVNALAAYTREIYAAADSNDLTAAAHAHQRLTVIMSWVLHRLRSHGYTSNAS